MLAQNPSDPPVKSIGMARNLIEICRFVQVKFDNVACT